MTRLRPAALAATRVVTSQAEPGALIIARSHGVQTEAFSCGEAAWAAGTSCREARRDERSFL